VHYWSSNGLLRSSLFVQYALIAVAIWTIWTLRAIAVTTWNSILLWLSFRGLLFNVLTSSRTLVVTLILTWLALFLTCFMTRLLALLMTRNLNNFFMHL